MPHTALIDIESTATMKSKTPALVEKPIYTQAQTQALGLYLRQYETKEISDELSVNARTVQQWISRFGWKKMRDDAPVELMLRQRIAYLLWIDQKHASQLSELEMLLEQKYKRDEAIERKKRKTHHDEGSAPTRGRPSNKVKNDISGITAEMLAEFREKTFFGYQNAIHSHKCNDDINEFRFYLKSRQIGLTYYFAFEAFEDAILSGDNQIFLSASRKQSEIFKNYIRRFALEIGDVELKGKDELWLSNGACLNFLSTNARTSQGFNGHLYFDEVFWIPRFQELDDLAGGMSIQDKYRTTYLSTPSSTAHEAYPKWAGSKELGIDISHKALKKGVMGEDGIFRQMITVDDAIKGGANFFNMDKLHRKYPIKSIFDNLLRCIFLDDSASFFNINSLLACKTDTSKWKDVNLEAVRPVGDLEVLVGYDPRGGGQGDGSDDAGLVVALKPLKKGGVFRFLERIRLKGSSYEQQAKAIEEIVKKYNVVHLEMDTSGVGSAVAELVRKFYPSLKEVDYSPEVKRMMAYKAREIINAGRLQFDDSWDDVVHSFLMIRQHTTKASNQITMISARTKKGSHADLAWAAMHVLHWEPIDILNNNETTIAFL
ncbi:terminase family protein [Shewanella sp. D64]|uniref:terminase large subunit domain-containing protein n=1 Tax=unclassified Shewanella TaxID=196818 RepID=UPI0022BA228C|nr:MULTISPECIES: terminase family protein [unclassified Shewanella]MEC4729006.1 terminase family protein [Shewanella sp. D64]MEC4740032.1 terminase family protein [Shewanella sp. E94]WBJ94388.1 terminase family protein [Shewanella sp. MTB7]